MRSSRLLAAAVVSVAATLCPVLATAQNQVDTTVGQVDPRVGGELYGHNAGTGILILPQVKLLPSEERYAIWRSGALPSEVEAGRVAAGPLTPNGVIDYLPRQSPLQRAMGLPANRLYNSAYDPAINNGRLNAQGQQTQQAVTRGYPQSARQGMAASNRRIGQLPQQEPQQPLQPLGPGQQQPQQPLPALRPPTDPVPGLTPAPEQPLPTGRLFDDVRYDPNSTEGARFLNRQLPRVAPPKADPPKPSLAEEKKE
jgi:hypothetical protein